jgi:hypothetical protein
MQVALQTRSALCLRVTRIDTTLLVEAIALVEAVPMFGPRAHTHPAELPRCLLLPQTANADYQYFNRWANHEQSAKLDEKFYKDTDY